MPQPTLQARQVLLARGAPADLAVSVVAAAETPHQHHRHGTLATLPELLHGIGNAAILLLGCGAMQGVGEGRIERLAAPAARAQHAQPGSGRADRP